MQTSATGIATTTTTIVLERESTQIPWGFRLKGGSEFNVPLSILKVNDGSPAHTARLESGDILMSVDNYSTCNLKHEEALNLIRMFDLSLALGIQRAQSKASFNSNSSAVWRPTSTPQIKPVQLQQQPISFDNLLAPITYVNQQASPPPPAPSVLIPPAPPIPIHLSPNSFFDSPSLPSFSHQQQQQQSQRQVRHSSPSPPPPPLASSTAHTSGHIPDALLRAMNAPAGSGRKPFTYTPGGLDLSHVRESARVKRYDSMSSNDDSNPYQTQRHMQSKQQQQQQQQQQQYSYNRQFSAPKQQQQQQQQAINRPSAYNQPKQQNTSQFVIQEEQLQEHNRRRKSSRDEGMNQSYSFRMLNKWIEDSETRDLLKSKKDQETQENDENDKNNKKFLNSEVVKLLQEEEQRVKKQQHHAPSIQIQKQASIESLKFHHSPNSLVPSRTFKQLDRAYNNNNNESDLNESGVSLPPPRERNPEPDVPKYKGANIPSRTFKYIQHMTGDDENNDHLETKQRMEQQQSEHQATTTPNEDCISEF